MGESWPWIEAPDPADERGADAVERRSPPNRPGAAPRWAHEARAWVTWFGAGRLAVTVIAALAVVVGAWWLLRAPPTPTEAALPYASGASVPGASGTAASNVPSGASGPAASAPPPTASEPMTVHVAGEVRRPGVYTLPPGALVDDAIEAAGGASARADVDAVNLAAPLADGAQVLVPRPGEVVVAPPSPTPAPGAAGGTSGSLPAAPVNVNTASSAELETLPDVGPATAGAILEHREQHGPFATVDDLDSVPGIGPVTLESLRDLVTVT